MKTSLVLMASFALLDQALKVTQSAASLHVERQKPVATIPTGRHTQGCCSSFFALLQSPLINEWSLLLKLSLLPPWSSTHCLIKFHANQITSCLWLFWRFKSVLKSFCMFRGSWDPAGCSEVVGCGLHSSPPITQNCADWRIKSRVTEGCESGNLSHKAPWVMATIRIHSGGSFLVTILYLRSTWHYNESFNRRSLVFAAVWLYLACILQHSSDSRQISCYLYFVFQSGFSYLHLFK